MKKAISFSLFFFLFIFLSVSVKAYQNFNQNPSFISNNNGYYIADSFTNSSCFFSWCTNNTYSCFDVQNTSGSLILSNSSRCDFSHNFNSASVTIKMLSDNSFYKMNNGDYVYMLSKPNSKWCDQPETSPFGINLPGFNFTPPVCSGWDYMVLPKNKEGIIVLNYTLADNSYLDGSYTVLEAWENGITKLNSTLIWNGGNNVKKLFIPPATYDRNITIFASWKWYTDSGAIVIPVTNITINKFQFYTLDINEIRNDFTNNATYEIQRYCGDNANYTIISGETHYAFYNDTSYDFGHDENNITCGLVRLGDLILARHWNSFSSVVCGSSNYYYWARDLFFVHDNSHYAWTGLFESFLRNQVKVTTIYNTTTYNELHAFIYNDIYGTTLDIGSFRENYSTAFRQIINLTNNPNINITNQNPSGTFFKHFSDGDGDCTGYIFPFFTSNIQIDNQGWTCSDIANSEQYVLYNGSTINVKYCGDVGCNLQHTHCNFHYVGTYCENNYDWIYSDALGIIDSGSCSPNLCINQTNGIGCYKNITNEYIQCLDNNGVVTDCPSVINPENSKDLFVNPLNYLAVVIGSLAGQQNNLPLSQVMFSFLISLIVAGIISVIGRKSRHIEKIFGISFIGMVIFFTFAFFGNIYLIAIDIVFIIMSAGILSGIFNKWFGGG